MIGVFSKRRILMRCGSQGNQDTAAYTTTPDHIIQSTTQDMVRPSAPANSALSMATEPKAATEDVKIDLFEDDDEFEEFEINEEWDDKEEGKEVTQQWEDDWDDDDVSDDFSLQLRRELESNTEKN
ncbi:Protein DELETION OF SUV3 SUPPRESSOR 1(I) [Glycine soja]